MDLSNIRCLILDIDGVCTNGRLIYNEHGLHTMTFHAHDGAGIKHLLATGYEVAIISGNTSPIIQKRMQNLGVQHIFLGQDDKVPAFKHLLKTLSLDAKDCAYVGDDLPDIPLIQRAGFGCAVANAQPDVKAAADHVTTRDGGDGAVREVINLLLANSCVTSP